MSFVVPDDSPARGERRKTIDEEVEEDMELTHEWALRSEARYCYVGCATCRLHDMVVWFEREDHVEGTGDGVVVKAPLPFHVYPHELWFAELNETYPLVPKMRDYNVLSHYFENWISRHDEDCGRVKNYVSEFAKFGRLWFVGYDHEKGFGGMGWASRDWAAVKIGYSRLLMMPLVAMVQACRVLGGDINTYGRDYGNKSPAIVRMANLAWGVMRMHGPHPGENYFDDVLDKVLLLQIFRELTWEEYGRMTQDDMYGKELRFLMPRYPMVGQVFRKMNIVGGCDFPVHSVPRSLYWRNLLDEEMTLAIFILVEAGMAPWLLDKGVPTFPMDEEGQNAIWGFMDRRGWEKKGPARLCRYELEGQSHFIF